MEHRRVNEGEEGGAKGKGNRAMDDNDDEWESNN